MTTTTAPDPSFWNRIADKYAAQPVANPDAFEKKIEITRSLMDSDSTVLDIGCGTGSLVLRLATAGESVHGLDFSPEMIRIAREKSRAQGVSNVVFHCGAFDESFTEFEPESLDGICAYSLLHLVPDRVDALARIHRLLRPGGFFVSSTACLGESRMPYGALIAIMRLFGKAPRDVASISKAQLAAEMLAAGFVGIEQPDVGADVTTAFMVAQKPARA